MSCIFCKIANREIAKDFIYQDDKVMVFEDINPQAPFDFLIVPKKHIPSVDHLEVEDKTLMGELILTTQKIAKEKKLKGYKLLINVGRTAGQVVDHLHIHLLAN